jgi:cupin 2 domain-containing protein
MQLQNLFSNLPASLPTEAFDELVHGEGFKLERIISTGQSTPPGEWFDQSWDEWVLLLRGAATLRIEDEQEIPMRLGDCLRIPAHCRHRVEWTDPTQPTVWLALHFAAPLPVA